MLRKGVLLINLGTPDSFNKEDVKKYLLQFLLDRNVINLPYIQRQLLVRGVIVPRRLKESSDNYRSIWMDEGSPLAVWTKKLTLGLSELLGKEYMVMYAMRYQNPSIESVLNEFKKNNIHDLSVIPLFPQPAGATTGSILENVDNINKRCNNFFKIKVTPQFEDHPLYINALVEKILNYDLNDYDHLLFSFHGLPKSYLSCSADRFCKRGKDYDENKCKGCYLGACHRTMEAVVNHMKIPSSFTSIAFQSRLGRAEWIKPYFTEHLEALVKHEKKRLLVISPSFVSDCVETLFELGIEGRDLFISLGGSKFDLVDCPNDSPALVKTVASMI